jgi:class 3 adenylate cyclase
VVRLSDEQRDSVIALLRRHTGDGRLTLDEFSERAEMAFHAQTKADLDALFHDLPDLDPTPTFRPAGAEGTPTKRQRIVAIMSGARRRGRWRASSNITCFAWWGSVDLDFRSAVLEGEVIDIKAWAIMGGVDVVVPEGVSVEVDGFLLMGGLEDRVKPTARTDGPVIRVHGYGMWGGVRVRTKKAGEPYNDPNPFVQNHNWNQHQPHALPIPPIPDLLLIPPFGNRERHDARVERRYDRRDERRHDRRPGRRPPSADEGLIDHLAADPEPAAATTAPSGTVTILFTDIAQSTELAERIGDQRWMGVLGAHNALVREQLARQGGTEVKHHGDGFMAVFPSARKALLCSIGIQRAMASYRLGHPETPIEVRIGLHTGEVVEEDGDYFGRNVILAARIAAVAEGGEILASGLVKELADSGGDLGFDGGRDVELKGMSRPWRVHTVDW